MEMLHSNEMFYRESCRKFFMGKFEVPSGFPGHIQRKELAIWFHRDRSIAKKHSEELCSRNENQFWNFEKWPQTELFSASSKYKWNEAVWFRKSLSF